MNTKVLVVDDEKTSRNLFEMIIKESERFCDTEIIQDLARRDRVVKCRKA